MIVYKATNTINGKVYIGKTSQSLSQRWKLHLKAARLGERYYFHRAIRKYGPEVFALETLYRAKTADELSKMETFFIVLHQSHEPENGYNMTLGGDGVVSKEAHCRAGLTRRGRKYPNISASLMGHKVPEASRRRMSISAKNRPPSRLGKTHSEESRKRIGAAGKGRIPWNKGIEASMEARQHQSESHQGKKYAPRSVEHSRKISENKKRWWAERKAKRMIHA